MNSGIFLQVLEFLALRGILTVEKINEGPRFEGMERLIAQICNFLFYFIKYPSLSNYKTFWKALGPCYMFFYFALCNDFLF
jgi:hypothetical protein